LGGRQTHVGVQQEEAGDAHHGVVALDLGDESNGRLENRTLRLRRLSQHIAV
jgi:hypothetical protein